MTREERLQKIANNLPDNMILQAVKVLAASYGVLLVLKLLASLALYSGVYTVEGGWCW